MARCMGRYAVLLIWDLAGASHMTDVERCINELLEPVGDTATFRPAGESVHGVTDATLWNYLRRSINVPSETMWERFGVALNRLLEECKVPPLPLLYISEATEVDQAIRRRKAYKTPRSAPAEDADHAVALLEAVDKFDCWGGGLDRALEIHRESVDRSIRSLWINLITMLLCAEYADFAGLEEEFVDGAQHMSLYENEDRQFLLSRQRRVFIRVLSALAALEKNTGRRFPALGLFARANAVINRAQALVPWERFVSSCEPIPEADQLFRAWQLAPAPVRTSRLLRNVMEMAQFCERPDVVLDLWDELEASDVGFSNSVNFRPDDWREGYKLPGLEDSPLLCCSVTLIHAFRAAGTAPVGSSERLRFKEGTVQSFRGFKACQREVFATCTRGKCIGSLRREAEAWRRAQGRPD